MLYQGGEREKIHTLEIGGHVQMAKSDPEAQRKPSLSDCTWLESEYGSFNLEASKFLCTLENRGVHFIFIFTHTHIFFSFSHISLSFFLSFSHFFFFFLIKILFASL
jgi:hypothetical protein